MKKLMTLLLAAVLLLSLGTAAFAADPPTYTITVESGVAGQTYKAYKIFDLTLYDQDKDGEDDDYDSYAYTISTSSPWFAVVTGGSAPYAPSYTPASTDGAYGLTFTKSATDDNLYVVTASSNFSAAKFAEKLRDNLGSITTPYEITYSDTVKTFTVTELGYYFVDSSLGALCSLDTTDHNVTIYDKNSAPSIAKTVKNPDHAGNDAYADKTTYQDTTSADIGDTLNYRLVINTGTNESYLGHTSDSANLGTGVDAVYTITDVLGTALTYNGDTFAPTTGAERVPGTVTADTVAVTDDDSNTWTLGTDYWVTYASNQMVITLKATSIARLAQNKNITITYNAVLNENAAIAGTGNVNTATLNYHEKTVEDTATAYTYAIAIRKVSDKGVNLSDATFELPFYVVSEGANVYRYDGSTAVAGVNTNSVTTDENGVIIIKGLDAATYNGFAETAAPAGFNRLTSNFNMTAVANTDTSTDITMYTTEGSSVVTDTEPASNGHEVKMTYEGFGINEVKFVVNMTGTELPSTGGIGTTIFYILGGLMVTTALVLFITKKRLSVEE